MMTDIELLKLAAKAAKHEIDPIDAMHDPDQWVAWNPLNDDGDALRLLTCLKMEAKYTGDCEEICISWWRQSEPFIDCVFQQVGQDINAAIRRAIVRAAAEIGKEES